MLAFAPLLFYRMVRSGKYREGLWEKFWGEAPRRIGERPCLWFHAVSVGEVLLLRPLVEEMARRRPSWEVVISTTTPTGLAVARRTFPDLITFYAPSTSAGPTRRAMARVRPTVLALVELELWPNLIRAAKQSGAKVAIINARLSPRSHRGYREPAGPAGHRPCAASTSWPRRTQDYARGSSTWASRTTGSASPARSSTTAWRATGTTPRRATSAGELGLSARRPGLRGREHDGGRGGRGPGGVPSRPGRSTRGSG